MAEKPTRLSQRFTTPRGKLLWPFLTKARDYKNNGVFSYDTSFILEGSDAEDLKKIVDDQLQASKKTMKAKKVAMIPYEDHEDEEGNAVDGAIRFRFKLPAQVETKQGVWKRRPALFDAKGKPFKPDVGIGNGTEAKISFRAFYWKNPSGAGITLQLDAVQILDLVEYNSEEAQTSEDYGFGEEEGWSAPEGNATPDSESTDDDESIGPEDF